MNTALVAAVGGGIVSALFHLSVLFGGMGALILGYLAPFPLFLVGLWLGAGAAAIAGAVGAAVTLAVSGSLLVSGSFVITGALPVAVVVRQALLARSRSDGSLEWYPPGLLVTVLTGIGVAGFLAALLLASGEPGGLEGLVRAVLGGIAAQLAPPDVEVPGGDAFWIAPALPGLVAVSWLLMTVVNGTLAQGVLMRFGRNRRPGMRLVELVLPPWLAPAFAAASALALLVEGTFGFVALNVALILSVPFLFAGLAVVHAFARRRPARVPVLVGFYMFLVLFGWPVVVVIGLGVIEQWMGLRRRWSSGPRQEDE